MMFLPVVRTIQDHVHHAGQLVQVPAELYNRVPKNWITPQLLMIVRACAG